MMSDTQESTNTIRTLNDRFRQTMPDGSDVPGRLMITAGIQALASGDAEPAANLRRLLDQVRRFDDFSNDNDPYREHDFGAIDFGGNQVFWKIDYYAPDLMQGSEDPADTDKTVRVLTVMLAEEY